ncbi:hypothetical protein FACS189438_2550 [Bacteroidia bacterium]|nr:hypothetical protein FACS189438_2550 [Bacteroidia bacterium]
MTEIDSSQVPNYEPLVFLTEAYIEPNTSDKGPKIRGAGTGNTAPYYIELTIGNRATAQTDISSNTPVAVYKNNSITDANRTTYPLSDLYAPGTATALGTGFTVKAGEDTTIWIPVGSTAADANNVYIVRLGDDSDASNWRFGYNGGKSGTTYLCTEFNQGIGLASRAFRDCDWCDQVVRAARYRMFDDFYTVQAYNEVPMNILTNDILPNNSSNRFFPDLVLAEANINTPPRAGTLTFNGRPGANNRVTYRHEGQPNPLFANIDSFEYKLTFFDESLSQNVTKYAWVYIYIMNSSTGGFAACYGAVTNIELQNKPVGVSFEWYKDQSSANLMQAGRTRTTGQMFADSTYWLKPVMTNISTAAGNGVTTAQLNHYKTFDFPRGKLTVSLVTPTPGTTALMRWTGLVSTEWQNPDNWVAVKTDANGKPYETPVTFAPTECANVIIPSTADFYPELRLLRFC